MAEELLINNAQDKQSKYDSLIPQIEALVIGESDLIANLANISAALKEGMGFFWVGFYLVKNDELVLGPFQGTIACTRIKKGKGVCGKVWENKTPIIVKDVDEFPGHIACSNNAKSEIVLPVLKDGEVALMMDVDSDQLNDFNEVDRSSLQKVIDMIEKML